MRAQVFVLGLAGAAAIMLGLCGCKPAGGPPSNAVSSEAAQSVAPTVSTAPASSSQAGETPQQFVARVFALYRSGSPWWADPPKPGYQESVYRDFYDPEFPRLMDENGKLSATKGGGVDLDYDPVCQCQDSGGAYRYLSGAQNGDFFDAKVNDDGPGQAPWTLVLKQTPAGWRIYDVIDSSGSVRSLLQRHDACMKAAKTEAAGEACIS
jgi:hypothetical protein